MMRPARFGDLADLVGLLEQQHAQSRYAGHVGIDREHARKLLAAMIHRNGHSRDGGAWVMVIESAQFTPMAFIAGLLDRVYGIGDRLVAQDMFLVASPEAPQWAAPRLINSYLDWADSIPAVFEINLSHTDALPKAERIEPLYRRLGFQPCGMIYRRAGRASSERLAA